MFMLIRIFEMIVGSRKTRYCASPKENSYQLEGLHIMLNRHMCYIFIYVIYYAYNYVVYTYMLYGAYVRCAYYVIYYVIYAYMFKFACLITKTCCEMYGCKHNKTCLSDSQVTGATSNCHKKAAAKCSQGETEMKIKRCVVKEAGFSTEVTALL